MSKTSKDIIGYLGSHIMSPAYPKGERASLRRLNTKVPCEPALLRLLANIGLSIDLLNEDQLCRWATISKAIALAAPLRDDARSVGCAMAQAKISEQRLASLLTARGDQFRSLVIRLVRQLVTKAEACNWEELGELILLEQIHEKQAERLRMRLATQYFKFTQEEKK